MNIQRTFDAWINGVKSEVWENFQEMNAYEKQEFLDQCELDMYGVDGKKILKFLVLKLMD